MMKNRFTTFTITYLSPISNQSGDEIYFEEYALANFGMDSDEVEWLVREFQREGSALVTTTEGLLYLNNRNIASIMFHEEDI